MGEQIEIMGRYAGYIGRQAEQIERIKRGEGSTPEVVSALLDSQGQVNGQLAQAIGDMMQQAIQQIRAPRRIVRDATGRAQGLE